MRQRRGAFVVDLQIFGNARARVVEDGSRCQYVAAHATLASAADDGDGGFGFEGFDAAKNVGGNRFVGVVARKAVKAAEATEKSELNE